jgi:ABC-type polysaccharide/polyol phosphate export permease
MKNTVEINDDRDRKKYYPVTMMAGVSDLKEGLVEWRIWHLIGAGDLRRRYSRSKIGQFWLTLSTGISILIMGFVWALLFKSPLADMLPHMAVSIILWQFIAGIIADSTNIFKANSHMLLSQKMPCSILVYASVYRNFLTFLHNLVIIPIIFVVFLIPVKLQIFLIFPGLVLFIITSVWLSYLLAALCARFGDLSNIVNSIMQLAFYVTPVIWKPDLISEDYKWIIWCNPFSYFLNIMRSPILGVPFSTHEWGVAALITFVGLLFSLIFIGKYRRQILYWM